VTIRRHRAGLDPYRAELRIKLTPRPKDGGFAWPACPDSGRKDAPEHGNATISQIKRDSVDLSVKLRRRSRRADELVFA
jgi:hypothetical protein